MLINPIMLYLVLGLGAVGLCLALPRRGINPQIVGGVIAAVAAGLILLMLGIRTTADAGPGALPNVFFYVFGFIALAAAVRVVTHPRPVYAALYFIMTVLASAGLFLILSAEFMAFALIIVYAGAILITYLFVIMLATQAPAEGQDEVLADYDTSAREPVAAAFVGFVMLAVLTTMMFRGVSQMPPVQDQQARAAGVLAQLPGKIERALDRAGTLEPGWSLAMEPGTERAKVDVERGTVTLVDRFNNQREAPLPAGLEPKNVDELGFNLLAEHPGSIEIAGVILLMAMLGAVVLSRKQVELDEEAKSRHASRLSQSEPSLDREGSGRVPVRGATADGGRGWSGSNGTTAVEPSTGTRSAS
ncbi:MAG: NADH-quinone oxidoreductase subunit J [Planctomycetota bacterium]|nr:NADH-quinone oxidoreductase subunit J [Planctomycetota bacterium]